MQPTDPIITIDDRQLDLHLFGLHLTVDQSLMWWGIFLAFGTTSYCIGLYRGRYRWSNMRAIIKPCRSSSVSTAETSPPTDQGVWIAVRSGYAGGTPGPRPTPHPEDSDKHTVRAQKQYWRQHRSVRSAGSRRRTVIHSLPTTSYPEARVVETVPCVLLTDHATAGPVGGSQDQTVVDHGRG